MKQYWTGAHTKHRLMVHIVWIPKYRKRILNGKLANRIEELLRECADANRWSIEELNIQPDHVHMILQFRPDMALSKIVQLFKGKSSRKVREEFNNNNHNNNNNNLNRISKVLILIKSSKSSIKYLYKSIIIIILI